MWEDSNAETKLIVRKVYLFVFAIILAVSGVFATGAGFVQGKQKEQRSSTPIGSLLTFPRSSASLVIKDYYTDKNEDVLIIRMAPDNASVNRLPFRGTDYSVYLNSKSLEGYKEASVLFGRMSTDGDFFLVIPKPSDDIYSVFIMNRKYIAGGESEVASDESGVKDLGESQIVDDEEVKASISKSLSEYSYDPEENEKAVYRVKSDLYDMVNFRVTMKPYIKDKAYEPKRLDAELLDGKKFNFDALFTELFKKPVISKLDSDVNRIEQQIKQQAALKSELEDKIAANPSDADSRQTLEELNNREKSLRDQQLELARKSAEYESLQYDSSLFGDMQTKADITSQR